MVYARTRETSERARLIAPHLGTPVVCTTMSLCADLAPLWPHREFFTAADPRELRQLLIELRFAGVDTVYLHLDAHDDLYPRSFPGGKPAAVQSMTVTQARSLYRTFWRTYELAMNCGDSLWAVVLENEAGRLLWDHRPDDALRLQNEALKLTPNSAAGHGNLALIYAALGQTLQARGEAVQALSLDPSLEEPRRLLEQLSSP
jgi:tetratricopeptide (TPR) repeat protein